MGVEIGVSRGISATADVGLADAARAVNEHLIKAPLAGHSIILIAQMPFAKDAGRVATPFQCLGQDEGIGSKAFPFEDGVGDPIFELMAAGKQGTSCGGTGGAYHMVV